MIRSNSVLSYLERRAIGFLVGLTCLLAIQSLPAEAQGYSIRPGDRLRIEVLEDDSLNRSVLVAPDGRISVPLVGTVVAGGRTLGAPRSCSPAAARPTGAMARTLTGCSIITSTR